MSLMDLLVDVPPLDASAEPRTKELWRQYVLAQPPGAPTMPNYATYAKMDEQARTVLNAERIRYHSASSLLRTPDVDKICAAIEMTMLVNQSAPAGAKRGIAIDGPPTAGKSTLVKMFARDYERALRAKHPHLFVDDGGDDYIPVVYLSVPSAATPKMLSAALAEHLALPVSRSARGGGNLNAITTVVLRALERCRTSLVIIDDVHFLDCSQKDGKLSNDHLKNLANLCSATFVFAGVDVEAQGLFSEGRAASRQTQTAGRFAVHRLGYHAINTKTKKMDWVRTIRSFEDAFLLYKHEPGSVAKSCWEYLYERSGGRMSTLSALMRQAAVHAIVTGDEAVTAETFDHIVTDVATQRAFETAKKKTTKRSDVRRAV